MLPLLEKRILQILVMLIGLACMANAPAPKPSSFTKDIAERDTEAAEVDESESAKSVAAEWVNDLSNGDELALERITSFPFAYVPVSIELNCKRVVTRSHALNALVQCIVRHESLMIKTLTNPKQSNSNTTRIVIKDDLPSHLRVLIGPLKKTMQLVYSKFYGDGVNYCLVFIVDIDINGHRRIRKVLIDSEYHKC